jgi:hypothetical protein
MNRRKDPIGAAIRVLELLGMPRSQQNERSALCLLALMNLTPGRSWASAENPLIGITPIMDWVHEHYKKPYAPNTRETFRRQTMHQFVDAGMVLYNPDDPGRSVNSPKAVYQIAPDTLVLLRSVGTRMWKTNLATWQSRHQALIARYARERKLNCVPVKVAKSRVINLSRGEHSELIRDIIERFGPRFVPGGKLIYVGDTGDKWGYFDDKSLSSIGVSVDPHGKMPDVVIFCPKQNWLLLVEAVTSYGAVDGKRHEELSKIFAGSSAGLVYVTAFPHRALLARYLPQIAWETEVWVADAPSHLIHFNGSRFLGPYDD